MSKRTLVKMESKRNAEEDAYLYWLCMLVGIGKKKRDALLTVAGSAKAVYELKEELIDELVFLSSADKEVLKTAKKRDVHSAYAMLKEQGVRFVMQHHKEYPGRLLHIPDAPFGLFVRGSLPKEELPCVAVIGARDCTEYGRYVALELGRRLAEAGIQVVSGMARGIDSIAQSACAGAGGEVYGVLGCGVDICYPKESRHLYERLLQKGGILSEYPMGTQPRSQLFPRRNRIISGLSDAVVVVEAREKSGTLITVDMALEQGREVYVIPGRVTDPLSSGCNRLIRQGAAVLTGPTEFIREIETLFSRQRENNNRETDRAKIVPIVSAMKKEKNSGKTDRREDGSIQRTEEENEGCERGIKNLQQEVERILYLQPKSLQQLYTELTISGQLEIQTLIQCLFEMERQGIIKKQDGYFELAEHH